MAFMDISERGEAAITETELPEGGQSTIGERTDCVTSEFSTEVAARLKEAGEVVEGGAKLDRSGKSTEKSEASRGQMVLRIRTSLIKSRGQFLDPNIIGEMEVGDELWDLEQQLTILRRENSVMVTRYDDFTYYYDAETGYNCNTDTSGF